MIFFKQGGLISCEGWALNFFKYQATTMLIWNSKIKKNSNSYLRNANENLSHKKDSHLRQLILRILLNKIHIRMHIDQ